MGVKQIAKRAPQRARAIAALVAAAALGACTSWPEQQRRDREKPSNPPLETGPNWHGTRTVLMYLPNRLFDLTDIVRLRLELGPGWAIGARATSFVPLFIGGYDCTWLGVHGPRNGPSIPLPFGLDEGGGFGLGGGDYGSAEFGVAVHLWMIGFDVGFDPRELVDFGAGFANVDLSHDDL